MTRKWIFLANLGLGATASCFLLAAACLFISNSGEISVVDTALIKKTLPKGAFVREKDAYEVSSESLLALKFTPMTMQLPDLRKILTFYGKNGRPDAKTDSPLLYFSCSGNKVPSCVTPGEKLYLLYDKKQNPPQFVFSPDNQETPLWIDASMQGNQAIVNVGMKSDNDELITEPAANAQCTLPEKEYVRFGGTAWEIGQWKVDGGLLSRQKAHWYGIDRFLEKHGGEEFGDVIGKQRIDFGEGSDIYSVYVGLNDTLVWEDNRWKITQPGTESLGQPLMVVKKIDDRLMNFELWDTDGKAKMSLNLLKSMETSLTQNLQQNFKFVGARTRSQFVFEIDHERMLLSPNDWLVLTEYGWVKLTTPEEIDEYVQRKVTGPLFVFDGISRKDERQVLLGTIFNPSRTMMESIELPVVAMNNGKGSNSNESIKEPDQMNQKGTDVTHVPYTQLKSKAGKALKRK